MISQIDNILWLKFNGLFRYILVHFFSNIFPLYIVNEYPKSGGTWVAQMLSEIKCIPFPRNRLPIFASSIMHGHYLDPWNMQNVLVVWRDGRDVLISQYFHYLFLNSRLRKNFNFDDYNNVSGNLPKFMEYIFFKNKNPAFSWDTFVHRWYGRKNVVYVKYEDLRRNPSDELVRLSKEVFGMDITIDKAFEVAEKYSFERQAGRKSGEEKRNSFMRKGIIGDWSNHFSKESRELFARYAGAALIKLGYERNNDWISE